MWYRQDLLVLKSTDDSLDGQLTKEILGILKTGHINPQSVWISLSSNWQSQFFINRFLLAAQVIEQNLSGESADMPVIWDKAKQLASERTSPGSKLGMLWRLITNFTTTTNYIYSVEIIKRRY